MDVSRESLSSNPSNLNKMNMNDISLSGSGYLEGISQEKDYWKSLQDIQESLPRVFTERGRVLRDVLTNELVSKSSELHHSIALEIKQSQERFSMKTINYVGQMLTMPTTKRITSKQKLFSVKLFEAMRSNDDELYSEVIDPTKLEQFFDWITKAFVEAEKPEDQEDCLSLCSSIFPQLSAKQFSQWINVNLNLKLLEINNEEHKRHYETEPVERNDQAMIVQDQVKYGESFVGDTMDEYDAKKDEVSIMKESEKEESDADETDILMINNNGSSLNEQEKNKGSVNSEKLVKEVMFILRVLRRLEETRRNKDFDASLAFSSKSSVLSIEKLIKADADFEFEFGFKFTYLKRQTTIQVPLITILSTPSEKQQTKSKLLSISLNFDSITQNAKLIFLVSKNDSNSELIELEYYDLNALFNYHTIRVSFNPKEKLKIFMQIGQIDLKKEGKLKSQEYQITSLKEVNVILGNELEMSASFGQDTDLVQMRPKAISTSSDTSAANFTFKVNYLEFRKDKKDEMPGVLSSKYKNNYVIMNGTLSSKVKLLSLKIDSFRDKCEGKSYDQSLATREIFDHFVCVEPEKKKSEGFFSKIFKSSSSDSGSQISFKSSWNSNSSKVKYGDLKYSPHFFPLEYLQQIGNWEILLYLLERILQITWLNLSVQKLDMILELFEFMTSLNRSHSLILDNMNEQISLIKKLSLCPESTCDAVYEMSKKIQLESLYEFFFTKNGFLILQGILTQTNALNFEDTLLRSNSKKEGGLSKVLLEYFHTINQVDEDLGYRCFVNVLMNISILISLPGNDPEILLDELSLILNKDSNLKLAIRLQKSLKIKYLLASVVQYYLPKLKNTFDSLKVENRGWNLKPKSSQVNSAMDYNSQLDSSSKFNEDSHSFSQSSTSSFSSTFQPALQQEEKSKRIDIFDRTKIQVMKIFQLIYQIISTIPPLNPSSLNVSSKTSNPNDSVKSQSKQDQYFSEQFQAILNFLDITQKAGEYILLTMQMLAKAEAREPSQTNGNNLFVLPSSQNEETVDIKNMPRKNRIPKTLDVSKSAGTHVMSIAPNEKKKTRKDSVYDSSSNLNSSSGSTEITTQSNVQEKISDRNSTENKANSNSNSADSSDLLEYSFLIKELLYLIKRIMKKQAKEDDRSTLIFRLQVIQVFIKNEQMYVPKKSADPNKIQELKESAEEFDDTSSVKSGKEKSKAVIGQSLQSLASSYSGFNPEGGRLANVMPEEQFTQSSISMYRMGGSNSNNNNNNNNNTNAFSNRVEYKLQESEASKDYMHKSSIMKYRNVDIVLDLNIEMLAQGYQEIAQICYIDIITVFIQQYQEQIVGKGEQLVKAPVYANYLNLVFVRMVSRLVELKEKSEKSLKVVFEQYLKEKSTQLSRFPLLQSNVPLLSFAHNLDIFWRAPVSQQMKYFSPTVSWLNQFSNRFSEIQCRKSLTTSQFMFFLSRILYNFSEHQLEFNEVEMKKDDTYRMVIADYLLYWIQEESDPNTFFKMILSILGVFITPQTKAAVSTRKPTKYTANHKPSLVFFIATLLKVLDKIQEDIFIEEKKAKHTKTINNLPVLLFVFEYFVVYCKEKEIDLRKFDSIQDQNNTSSLGCKLVLAYEQLIKIGKIAGFLYLSSPNTYIIWNAQRKMTIEKLVRKQVLESPGLDQLNGGPLRALLNGLFTLLSQLKDQDLVEKLLETISTTFDQYEGNADSRNSNIMSSMNANNGDSISRSTISRGNNPQKQQQSSKLKFGFSQSLIRDEYMDNKLSTPTEVNRLVEINSMLYNEQMKESIVCEHSSTFILIHMLKFFQNDVIRRYSSSLASENQLFTQKIQEDRIPLKAIQIIATHFAAMKDLGIFNKLSKIIKMQREKKFPLSNGNPDSIELLHQYPKNLFREEVKDSELESNLEKNLDSIVNLYFDRQLLILPAGVASQKLVEIPSLRTEKLLSVSSATSQISLQQQQPSIIGEGSGEQVIGQEKKMFNDIQTIGDLCLKWKQNSSDTDLMPSLIQKILSLILQQSNLQGEKPNYTSNRNNAFFRYLYSPVIQSIDLVSQLVMQAYQVVLLKEKFKLEKDFEEILRTLEPFELPKSDHNKEARDLLYYITGQESNLEKQFERKWSKMKGIMESESGVFWHKVEGKFQMQTHSQITDVFGRRMYVFFTQQENKNFKNHQEYQSDYMKYLFEKEKNEASSSNKNYSTDICFIEFDTQDKDNFLIDDTGNEGIREVESHEKEQEVEDIFAHEAQSEIPFKQESEYISLRQSLFGNLKILKFSDGDGEIVFESKKSKIRLDQKYGSLDELTLSDTDFKIMKKYLLGSLDPLKKDWKKVIKIRNINEIILQTYSSLDIGVEIFLSNNKSYFFTFYEEKTREEFISTLLKVCKESKKLSNLSMPNRIMDSVKIKKLLANVQFLWLEEQISNLEYLMMLNKYSGRSLNDVNQYYVFPWVITDYTSPVLDLNSPSTYRNLHKHIGELNEGRYQEFLKKQEDNQNSYGLYGSHFSTAVHVIYYLIRMDPFAQMNVQLQSGKFDHPDRLFYCMKNTWESCFETSSDLKELIPEFFFLPNFLVNHSSLNFGKRQGFKEHKDENLLQVGDVQLPPWAMNSPHLFVQLQRAALESKYVSENLHKWIDLIFGQNRLKTNNSFNPKTYKSRVKKQILGLFEKLKQNDAGYLRSIVAQTQCFGTFPTQIFIENHPSKLIGDVSYPIENLVTSRSQPTKISNSGGGQHRKQKNWKMKTEMEEKENPLVFFKIINLKENIFSIESQARRVPNMGTNISSVIYFIRRDASSTENNSTFLLNVSHIFQNNDTRAKSSKTLKIANKIFERQQDGFDNASATSSALEKIFAFFDPDIFFLVNQRLNTIDLYLDLECKAQITLTKEKISTIRCLNNIKNGTLIVACGSTIMLVDFNVLSLKKAFTKQTDRQEQISSSSSNSQSVFNNVRQIFGHFSPILLLEICAETNIIVSLDADKVMRIHTQDGKCMRNLSIDKQFQDFSKIRIHEGYIAIICRSNEEKPEGIKGSAICLQHINGLDSCFNIISDPKDEYIDFQFIDFKSVVICKRDSIEFWDYFMYHFLSTEDAKKIARTKKKSLMNLQDEQFSKKKNL